MRGRWPWLILALGAALPLARVLPRLTSALPGSAAGDVYKHTWPYWHILQTGAGWPETPYLNAAAGGVLLDLTLVPSILMAPFTALLGPAASANLWVWGSLTAVGGATFALCRHLTGGLWGPLAAGLMSQTAPYLMGYPLTSGVHERLAVWVFPLVILALLKLRDGEGARWRQVALAAGALGLATAGCQVYGLFSAALLVLLLPLWLGRQPVARFKRLLPAGAAMVAVLGVEYAVARWLTEHPRALAPQPGRLELEVGAPSNWLVPTTVERLLNPLAVRAQTPIELGDELYMLTYLGWVPLLAGLGGALWWWRRPPEGAARGRGVTIIALVAAGVAMAALALGPRFTIGDQGFWNPLSAALGWVIPVYRATPPVWQQVAAFSPLAAVGAAALVVRAGDRPWAAGLLLALALAERAWALPVPLVAAAAPATVPEIYQHLADAAPEDGALAEIPRTVGDTSLSDGQIFLAQTAHGQPIPVSINIGTTAWDWYLPVLRGLSPSWPDSADCLRSGGFRWVMLHRDRLSPSLQADRIVRSLSQVSTQVADDGERVLFDLGPPTGTIDVVPRGEGAVDLERLGLLGGPADTSRMDGTLAPFACPRGERAGGPDQMPAGPDGLIPGGPNQMPDRQGGPGGPPPIEQGGEPASRPARPSAEPTKGTQGGEPASRPARPSAEPTKGMQGVNQPPPGAPGGPL